MPAQASARPASAQPIMPLRIANRTSSPVEFRFSVSPLEEGAIKRFTVKMPPSSQFVKATARPTLFFNMQPLTSGRLTFLVILNEFLGDSSNVPASTIAWNYDNPDGRRLPRSTHEVLDGNQCLPAADNLIDVRVVVGKVRIADVVLFFRVET